MVEKVNLAFDYAVAAGPVMLSIAIGDGQIGGSALSLDGTAIGPQGTITNLKIGNGPALVAKKLSAKTLVAPVNDDTSFTSVTYTLTGGATHPPFTFSHELQNPGDGVQYVMTINFVAANGGL
ncbi:MAG TPA: hypothetical protein VHB25_11730 [Gemmatimonadaceae bacterium]|nr:hypothetical protein [Gemmatimonadaceae bacterium]